MKKAIISTVSLSLFLLFLVPGSHPAMASDSAGSVLTLPEAVQIAIEKNPAFRKSEERIKGADFSRQSVSAEFLPSISANYTYTALAQDPYMIANGHHTQVAHDTQYQWGTSIVQPLFTGFALSSRYNMAKLALEIKEKEKQQTSLDITKGVKSAYYRVLLTKKIRIVADEAFQTLSSHEKDAKMFFDRGIIRRNDLLRAQVALSNAVQFRERARADADIAVADMNRWLSSDINTDTRIADIDTIQCCHYQLDELMETGLKTRPQLQAMALAMETLNHAITLEKSAYYPEVSAIGSYWQKGDSPAADNNDFENDHNASIVLQAKWTLFDWNKTGAKVSKATSEKRAFDESIRETKDMVRLEIKSTFLNLGVAENNIKTAKVALSQAEENLRITQLGYRQEAATSTEVLDARTDLTQAKTNYYQTLYGYLDALAALEHAIGQDAQHGQGLKQNS